MVTYCSSEDVKRYLGSSVSFSTTSTPTDTEVGYFIDDAEDEINQRTQHAWKTVTAGPEYYDIPINSIYGRADGNFSMGVPIFMRHRHIIDFETAAVTADSDYIQLWDGSKYENWVTAKTEGRSEDYWLDNQKGVLYLKQFYYPYRNQKLRLKYRYKESPVPYDIRKACAMMVAIRVLSTDDRSVALNETGDPTRQNYSDRITKMQTEIDKILHNRVEFIVIGR